MGSKQALSNGNEPEELIGLLEAFQNMNDCTLTLTATVTMRNSRRDLLLTIGAVPVEDDDQGQTAWDCKQVACWGSEYKLLMGAITTLLYRLDFQLAEDTWNRVIKDS